MGEAAKKLDPEEEISKPKLRLAEDNELEDQPITHEGSYSPPDLKLLGEEDENEGSFRNDSIDSQQGIRNEDIFGKTKEEKDKEEQKKEDEGKDKPEDPSKKTDQSNENTSANKQSDQTGAADKQSGPVVDNFNKNSSANNPQSQNSPQQQPPTTGNLNQNKSDFQPGGGPALTANPGKKDITAPAADDFAKNKPGLDDSRVVSKAKMAKLGTQAAGKLAQGDVGGVADMAEQVGTKIAANAAGKATAAALVASGVGALAAGIADKAVRYATEKLMPLVKKYALPIVGLNAIVMLLIIGSLIGIVGAALKGGLGRGAGVAASAFNSEDVNNANIILGSQQSLINYKSFYLNQGHKDWGNIKAHVSSGWKPGRTYASAGCAITSCTMIARYYGMSNATPPMLGQLIAQKTSSMALNKEVWVQWMRDNGVNKKLVTVPQNVDAIRKEIQAGNPILAKGVTAFGASSQHWVVIVGVSDDGRYLILNDPSASRRGKAGRPSPASELGNKIKGLWALRDA
ncbi:MAG: hypothetical protein BWY19_00903 [bacterium ADurb.Bin212]|nr:MAG: hypothetical protein BWY19_00903 [bacterium ADurb.Bin212]